MKKYLVSILTAGVTSMGSLGFASSKSPVWTEVSWADEHLMGDYIGDWVDPTPGSYEANSPGLFAQVINVDVGVYDVRILLDLNRRATPEVELRVELEGKKLFSSKNAWSIEITEEGFEGTKESGNRVEKFSMTRAERLSPTLGKEPPEGAVVLFDGTSWDNWEHDDGREVTWNLLGDGSMEIEPRKEHPGSDPKIGGTIRTKDYFKDVKFHLEFRYPVEPGKTAQGRGNSGFFFQGARGYQRWTNQYSYEIQVLNSHGQAGNWDECGSLYRFAAPKVNAARAPMIWQTYDGVYKGAVYDENGELKAYPRITVYHNGTLIHDDVEITHMPVYLKIQRDTHPPKESGPFYIQDHSNRIQYRNIWVLPLD